MKSWFAILIWFCVSSFAFGQKNQNGSVMGVLERKPFVLNGHQIRLGLESSDYNKGTGSDAVLNIYIDMADVVPDKIYAEMKVTVLDSEGAEMVAEPLIEAFPALTRRPDCAHFRMNLKNGQRIETIKIHWGGASGTYRYSKGQIGDIYVF